MVATAAAAMRMRVWPRLAFLGASPAEGSLIRGGRAANGDGDVADVGEDIAEDYLIQRRDASPTLGQPGICQPNERARRGQKSSISDHTSSDSASDTWGRTVRYE